MDYLLIDLGDVDVCWDWDGRCGGVYQGCVKGRRSGYVSGVTKMMEKHTD